MVKKCVRKKSGAESGRSGQKWGKGGRSGAEVEKGGRSGQKWGRKGAEETKKSAKTCSDAKISYGK